MRCAPHEMRFYFFIHTFPVIWLRQDDRQTAHWAVCPFTSSAFPCRSPPLSSGKLHGHCATAGIRWSRCQRLRGVLFIFREPEDRLRRTHLAPPEGGRWREAPERVLRTLFCETPSVLPLCGNPAPLSGEPKLVRRSYREPQNKNKEYPLSLLRFVLRSAAVHELRQAAARLQAVDAEALLGELLLVLGHDVVLG